MRETRAPYAPSPVNTRGRTLDYAAPLYDLLSPIMTFWQERRCHRDIVDELRLGGGERVLDVGCGTGMLTLEAAARLSNSDASLVVGLDAAPNMIRAAKRKRAVLNNIRFDVAPAEELPYEDESFDAVISSFFFHHVDFGLKMRVLGEMRRVLKKHGCAVIADVDIPYNLFGASCAWCGYLLFRQEEIRENIRGRLREAFDLSGFRDWHQLLRRLGYISIFKLIK